MMNSSAYWLIGLGVLIVLLLLAAYLLDRRSKLIELDVGMAWVMSDGELPVEQLFGRLGMNLESYERVEDRWRNKGWMKQETNRSLRHSTYFPDRKYVLTLKGEEIVTKRLKSEQPKLDNLYYFPDRRKAS